jgi:hypothetical protein
VDGVVVGHILALPLGYSVEDVIMFELYKHLLPFACPKYSAIRYVNYSEHNPTSILLAVTVTLPSKEHQHLLAKFLFARVYLLTPMDVKVTVNPR